MGVVAFSHLAIRVRDLDRALACYRDRLGFADVSRLVVTDTPSFREAGLDDVEMVAWFGRRDGTTIELQAVTSRSGRPVPEASSRLGFRHLAFRVRGVDATAEAVRAAGGHIDPATRTANPDVGGEAVFGADPDGQRLELLELAARPDAPIGEPIAVEPGADGRPGTAGDGTVTRFSHIAVGVTDLARALRFYAEALSGEVVTEAAGAALVRVGDTYVRLEQVTSSGGRPGIAAVHFEGPRAGEVADPDGARLVVVPAGDGRSAS